MRIFALSIIAAAFALTPCPTAAFEQRLSDEADGPSSAWYDLSVGTTRYYDYCAAADYFCTGGASYVARETVHDHEIIDGVVYAKVEWWYRAFKDLSSDPDVMVEDRRIFYFRMKASELLQYVDGEDIVVYDFGFERGDQLERFVGVVHNWVAPFGYGEHTSSVPSVIQGDTTITAINHVVYRTVWGSDTYGESMPAPVLEHLISSERNTLFTPHYEGLFYYVEGLGVWHSGFNHWGIPMHGVRIRDDILGATPTSTDLPQVVAPSRIVIHPNYPNPAQNTSTFSFDVAETARVQVHLINTLGQTVVTLSDEQMTPGQHVLEFDVSGLAKGVYFLRVQAGSHQQTRAITVR